MHTQGGTHERRPVATAGVMLFKGPQARWCTHKAEHTKGGLWPPQESCYLRGHRQGGAHTRRCSQKAVYQRKGPGGVGGGGCSGRAGGMGGWWWGGGGR